MPKFDGTGPSGLGQRTGRGLGPCGGGMAFGGGYGRGYGGRRFLSRKEEKDMLQEEVGILGEELKAVKERLAELGEKSK